MAKVETAVKRETLYIGVSVVIMSALMEAVFLIIGKWGLPVLCGNLLGGTVAVMNFFLMGLTVQKAVSADEKQARTFMATSRNYRMMMMLVVVVIAGVVPFISLIATVISLLFPRIAILARPFVGIGFTVNGEQPVKSEDGQEGEEDAD